MTRILLIMAFILAPVYSAAHDNWEVFEHKALSSGIHPAPEGRKRAQPALINASRAINTSSLVPQLANKVASIQSACPGTSVISAHRCTRIRGSGRMSLHCSGKAVDLRGPYACIYGQLRDWSGGYSTDAHRVQHIHISYDASGGREMGLKFAHYGGSRKSKRYARRYRQAPVQQATAESP